MNRRLLPVVALVAVVGLGAAVGVYGMLPGGADADPGADGTPTATPDHTATPADDGPVSFDDGAISLETAAGQTVRGETDLDPGTNLTIRLKNTNTAHPFVISAATTVDDDGTFAATFDLSGVVADDPATFDVVLLHDGQKVANSTGRLEPTESEPAETTTPARDTADREDGPYTRLVTVNRGNITLANASGQVVRGETDLDPGTELTVRLRSSNSESPFVKSKSTIVESDGTFRATFDLTGVQSDTQFDATVRRDGESLATADGEVVSADVEPSASLDYEGERLTLQNQARQVVTGQTSLESGETVLVRVHGAGETPFLQSRETTVSEDGTFEATFDLSDVPADATFRFHVRYDGERLTYAPGEVADG